jgi:CheY-like chemotaxis protein
MPRALVIDGNADDVRFISETLAARGFTIDVAGDGAHALETIERTRPDVVLLDVAGANADGMEVLDRIRASPHSRHAVVIVTAKTAADVLAGYSSAHYYPTKPITRGARYAIGSSSGATPE